MNQDKRQKFVNDILLKLDMCNYGFQIDENHYASNGYNFTEAKNMRAIKELRVRLNIWLATSKEDKGEIDYPEANRIIKYHLHPTDINKSRVNLLRR